MYIQSLCVHRNTQTWAYHILSHTCTCPSHTCMSTVTQCTCPVHSVAGPQAAAHRPHLIGTWDIHANMYMCCNARQGHLHVSCIAHGRYVLPGIDTDAQGPTSCTAANAPPPGKPVSPCPLQSQLTRFPFSPNGPRGPGRPIDP